MPYRKHLFRTFLLFPFPLFQNLTELEEDIDTTQYNNLGHGQSIDSYTSTNMFVCPSDGYVGMLDTGYLYIYGADSTSLSDVYVELNNPSQGLYQYIFVRKGMKVYGVGGVKVFAPLQAHPDV